jgi:hypothetical protein
MLKPLLPFFAAVLLLPGAVAPAAAQPVERTLLVTATTKSDGEPVDRLAPEDVVVREDGVAREVLRVAKASDPLLIVLVVDNSQASRRAMQDTRLALTSFVKAFAGGPHQITIVTVAERPVVVTPPTTSENQLMRAAEKVFPIPGSGAYLLEGIWEQARDINKREPARSAIITISSQGQEFSDRPPQFVIDALARSGASLHVLELQETDQAPPLNQGVRDRNVVFDRGTTETGGQRELLIANLSLTDALMKVGRVVTSQHEVVYARPDTLIPPRRVTVTAAKTTMDVRGNVLRSNQEAR